MPKQKNTNHSLCIPGDAKIDKEDIILPWNFEPREMEELGESIECLESCSTQSDLSSINSSELSCLENIVGRSFLEKRETIITPPDDFTDDKELLNDRTPPDDKG
jgi:hypothetical protein